MSMPPMLPAKASGMSNRADDSPAPRAMLTTMGSISATVPVLLTKAATTLVTIITRKKSFTSLVPASLSRRPDMVRAKPV